MKKYNLFFGGILFFAVFSISCSKLSESVINNSQKKDISIKQEKSIVSKKKEESDEILEKDKQNQEQQQNEKQQETYANIKELEFHYKETLLPFDVDNYYEEGIWETRLDADGSLIAYGRNDMTKCGNLLSWKDGKQMQIPLPSGKNVPKKLKTGYGNIVPIYYENTKAGYLLYQINWKRKTYLCYLLDKKGKIKEQIPLQDYLDQKIKEDHYQITDIQQTEKNKINVLVSGYNETLYRKFRGIFSQWDTFYLLEIDLVKKELSTVRKYPYWLLGADEKNVYGIDFNQTYRSTNFPDGTSFIENKRTKELIDYSDIPKDVITDYNDCISQCFDVKNGMIYLANRTGVYRKREDKKYVWERLMKPEDSVYLNENYTLTDITVVNDHQFYLMFLLGDDDETASILAQYDKKEVS